ncbi:hypothetical protein Tco_0756093 [Tanacetum coccineum]
MGADLQDELAIPSLKRVREIDDEQTSVQISFKRKAKRSLKNFYISGLSGMLKNACYLRQDMGSDEDFECGEETYFPALNVGSDKSIEVRIINLSVTYGTNKILYKLNVLLFSCIELTTYVGQFDGTLDQRDALVMYVSH